MKKLLIIAFFLSSLGMLKAATIKVSVLTDTVDVVLHNGDTVRTNLNEVRLKLRTVAIPGEEYKWIGGDYSPYWAITKQFFMDNDATLTAKGEYVGSPTGMLLGGSKEGSYTVVIVFEPTTVVVPPVVVNPADTLNQFITNLQGQIASLKSQITTQNGTITTLNGTISNLNGNIATKDASIANLTTANANLTTSNTAKDKQITSLTADGVAKDASIKSLTAAGAAKDLQIADLTKQNATITTSNTNLLAENANKDAEIVALTTTNKGLIDSLAKWPEPVVVIPPVIPNDLQPVVDSLKTLVISKDVTIGSLSTQLGEKTDSIATLVATGESFKSQIDKLIADTLEVSIITLKNDQTETKIVTPFGEGEYEIRVSSTPNGLLKVATDGTVFVSIVDLQGKTLKSESSAGEVTIQITDDGVYFARIEAQTSLGLRTKIYKFIVTSSPVK